MSLFGTALAVLRVGRQVPTAVDAFLERLHTDGNPIAAIRAFTDATSGAADDQVAVALETAARQAVAYAEVGIGWCLRAVEVLEASRPVITGAARVTQAIAETVADPRWPAQVDAAIGGVLDVGYQLVGVRARLTGWLEA